MSCKGDCWDNAVAESFFHSLKTEWTSGLLYRGRSDARSDVIHYIEMFITAIACIRIWDTKIRMSLKRVLCQQMRLN